MPLRRQTTPALNTEIVQRLGDFVQNNRPAQGQGALALDDIAVPLLAMQARGYTLTQMVGFLAECDLVCSEEILWSFFSKHWETRLAVLDQRDDDRQPGGAGVNSSLPPAAKIALALKEALQSGNGLFLHYQPQIDTLSGKISGAEALVRWELEGALVPPSEFVPIAEATGLINDLGAWVLQSACHKARAWLDAGLGDGEGIPIGVNLSVKQISTALPELVRSTLKQSGLPARVLSLEITESVLADKSSAAVLASLRQTGVKLSMDDFGTGYSCLAQLGSLPLDILKIDRMFVQALDVEQGRGLPIVETIINLARHLGLETVAEGIETPAQARQLAALGCTTFQGYLFSKPLSAERFVTYAQALAESMSTA